MATLGTFTVPSSDWDYQYSWSSDTWKPTFTNQNTIGLQMRNEKRGSSPLYQIDRPNMGFDTSTIPTYSLITGGTLKIYVTEKQTSLGINYTCYVIPHTGGSANAGGFGDFTVLGSLVWNALGTNTYWEIPLDTTKNPINKGGTTDLGIIGYHDYANVTPAIQALNQFYFQASGDANPTQLIVSYETGAGLDTTSKMW